MQVEGYADREHQPVDVDLKGSLSTIAGSCTFYLTDIIHAE